MSKFKWQEDNWVDLHTEEGEILDANLWTCDRSGKQYISFYPTDSMHGYVRTLDMPITTYRVIEEKPDD